MSDETSNLNDDADESEKTAVPVSKRVALKSFNDSIGRVVRVLIGGGIITWAVFNLSWNLMAARAEVDVEQNWRIAWVVIFFTCVIPLIFGFRLLFGSLAQPSKSGPRKSQPSKTRR
ncbi:MAG: hypothetical protein AAFN77_00520 [Planctomycetota bacterium]